MLNHFGGIRCSVFVFFQGFGVQFKSENLGFGVRFLGFGVQFKNKNPLEHMKPATPLPGQGRVRDATV